MAAYHLQRFILCEYRQSKIAMSYNKKAMMQSFSSGAFLLTLHLYSENRHVDHVNLTH